MRAGFIKVTHHMSFLLLIGFSLAAQAKSIEASPLDYARSLEIEILDREVKHRSDSVLFTRGQLNTAARLVGRPNARSGEVERLTVELRNQVASEAELTALLALKVHERDVLRTIIPRDDPRGFELLLKWIRARAVVAELKLASQTEALERFKPQPGRRLPAPRGFEDAELAHRTALASLAEIRMHEARVLLDEARATAKPDPVVVARLESESRQAKLRSVQMVADNAVRRLDIARTRVKNGLMPPSELTIFEKAASDASGTLEMEKKAVGPSPNRP